MGLNKFELICGKGIGNPFKPILPAFLNLVPELESLNDVNAINKLEYPTDEAW